MDTIESKLLPLVDFVASKAIKEYNTRYSLFDKDHIVLTGGGKAFGAYLEKEHRPESFDWDAKIYISNTIVLPDTRTAIVTGVLDNITQNINRYLKHKTVPFVVHAALPDLPHPKDSTVFVKHGERTSIVSGIKVYYIKLYYKSNNDIYPITDIIELTEKTEDPGRLSIYINAVKECNSRWLIDKKRYYIPYDDLKAEISRLAKDVTYPKQEKSKNRLELIKTAELNNHLVCGVRDTNTCMDDVVFDFTGTLNGFNVVTYNPTEHYGWLTSNPKFLNALQSYTGADYSKVNAALLESYLYQKKINTTPHTEEIINNLTECFNADKPDVALPLSVYRNTGFMYFKNVDLYGLKTGDVLPNITYLSTTMTNQNSHVVQFAEDAQFKGCLFKINIKSNKGFIVIGDHSYFPDEKELLLDYRGALKIVDVKYKYSTEYCNKNVLYMERLFIECDYIPYGSPEFPNDLNKSSDTIFIDAKGIDQTSMFEDNENRNVGDVLRNFKLIQQANYGNQENGDRIDTVIGPLYVDPEIKKMTYGSDEFEPFYKKHRYAKLPKLKTIILLVAVLLIILLIYIWVNYKRTLSDQPVFNELDSTKNSIV